MLLLLTLNIIQLESEIFGCCKFTF